MRGDDGNEDNLNGDDVVGETENAGTPREACTATSTRKEYGSFTTVSYVVQEAVAEAVVEQRRAAEPADAAGESKVLVVVVVGARRERVCREERRRGTCVGRRNGRRRGGLRV